MINKSIIKLHFSKSAKSYEEYARIQSEMAEKLAKMIDLYAKSLENKRRLKILDIGCGTGYLTEILLNIFPDAQLTAVDIAPGMISYMQKKFSACKNIEYWCGDVESIEFQYFATREKSFDIVVSNAAFQWLNNVEQTIAFLASILKKGGIFGFSTFIDGTFYELHNAFNIAKKKVGWEDDYLPGQNFKTRQKMIELCKDCFLNEDGIYIFKCLNEKNKEYFSSAKDFMYSIKKIGANNSNNRRSVNLSLVKEAIKLYDALYSENGRVFATYNCFYLVAVKK